MANTDEMDELYLARLDKLERQIQRHRRIIVDHGNQRRNLRSWDTIQHRHDQRAKALTDHSRLIQQLIEELRFDADVLVQDFRRFFASTDTDSPTMTHRRQTRS